MRGSLTRSLGKLVPAYGTSSRGWERLTGERGEPEPPRRAPLRRIAVRIRPARRVCPIASTTVQSWRSGRPTRRQPPVEQRATARVTRVGTRPSRSSSMVSPSRRSEPRRLSSSYAQPQSGSVAPVCRRSAHGAGRRTPRWSATTGSRRMAVLQALTKVARSASGRPVLHPARTRITVKTAASEVGARTPSPTGSGSPTSPMVPSKRTDSRLTELYGVAHQPHATQA